MREQAHWQALVPTGDVERTVYPDFVFLYPYQPPAAPESEVRMQVWFENIFPQPKMLEYRLVLPDGWSAIPNSGQLKAKAGEKVIADFVLSVPPTQSTNYRRQALTLDVTIDGKYLGQLAEAVVDLRPELDWGASGQFPRSLAADVTRDREVD